MRLVCLLLAIAANFSLPKLAPADGSGNEKQRKDRALAFMQEGIARYDLGKFDESLDLFEKAYQVYPFAEALFGLAQSHRQLHHYERAAFFYRAYIRNKPDAENREQVAALIEEMDRMDAEQKASTRAPPQGVRQPTGMTSPDDLVVREHPQRRPEAWYQDGLGWTATAAGVVTSGVGGWFLISASDLDDQAASELDMALRADLEDRANSRRTIGFVTSIIGGTGLVVGLVKLAWTGGATPKNRTEVVFGSDWVGLRGSF